MSKFNPDFWEIVVDRAQLESYSNEDGLWHAYNRNQEDREKRAGHVRQVFNRINALIESELTVRQRQVVRLYYFVRLTQPEIAKQLGIPQQVVSQHLFGILRNGKRVGGAIARLQKLCEQRGIKW